MNGEAGWAYDVEWCRVIDGETVDAKLQRNVDFGFQVQQRVSAIVRLRLRGIFAPAVDELGSDKSKMELMALTSSGPLRAVTYKGRDKREWLTVLFVDTPDGVVNINDEMVRTGHADPAP